MFVLKSTHAALQRDYEGLLTSYLHNTRVGNEWREEAKDLQKQVDKLKGEGSGLLSKPFIKKLIRLCHPDKHKNSTVSNEITAELLKLK